MGSQFDSDTKTDTWRETYLTTTVEKYREYLSLPLGVAYNETVLGLEWSAKYLQARQPRSRNRT
jgi:hypothetical protein